MNILIVTRGVPSKRDPQWGSFEFDQAKALARLGHHVVMVSVDSRFRLYWRKWGLTRGEKDGIKTYNFFCCPAALTGLLGRRVQEAVLRWQWKKIESALLADGVHADIIYAHYLFNSYYAIQCLTKLNAPIVAIEHWSALNKEPLSSRVAQMARFTYPRVAQVLAVSRQLKERIQTLFGISAEVVPNMLNPVYSYTPQPHKGPFTFISVGSLRKAKGFDTLIRACAQLNLPQDQWRLMIVGGGRDAQRLKGLILQARLQHNISLVGQKSPQQINALLNESDAFVLASRSETFGVVFIEAMACGLPVIATRCGGPEEIIKERNGLLVPVGDSMELAKTMQTMVKDSTRYDRQFISNDCKARFSAEVIAKQLTTIFEQNIHS